MKLQITSKLFPIIFVVLVFLLLLSPLSYWYIIGGNLPLFSIVEQRELSPIFTESFLNFKMAVKRLFQLLPQEAGILFFNQFLDRSFQSDISSGIRDQFPLRFEQIRFNKGVERILIRIAYFFIQDLAIPADLESNYLIIRDKSGFIKEVRKKDKIDQDVINFRIDDYRKFLKDHPEINLYVYNIQTPDYTDWHPHAGLIPNADNGSSIQYFLENKPQQLEFISFEINSLSDYQKHFFRTDHHWNIHGALKGYREIYDMLSKRYDGISPRVEITAVKPIMDVDYLGSIARLTLHPIEPDPFKIAEYELPEFKTFREGEEVLIGKKDAYQNGHFTDRKYENHYREYYGWNRELILYQFENNSNRNLLLITSSHAICIQDLIASHYRETIVVDHRAKYFLNHTVDELIVQYDINDIIILGQPSVTYLSKDFLLSKEFKKEIISN